jgi:hypothetical protein
MTNDERKLKLAANVLKADYYFMDEVLSNLGGFLRFHVSLYSDRVIADRDEVYGSYVNRRQAIKWISDNVFDGKLTLDRYNEIKKATRFLTD